LAAALRCSHVALVAGFGVGADDWLRAGEAVANPGAVVEHQLQAVGANYAGDFASAQLGWVYLQLLSELGFGLRGQVKVLSNGIEGTYFDK
jgi:hypothetical protein